MTIRRYRNASQPKPQCTSLHNYGRALFSALALGSVKSLTDTLTLAPSPAPAVLSALVAGPAVPTPTVMGTRPMPAPTPGAPLAVPGIATPPGAPGPASIAPNVIMQSFYAQLSLDTAQSGANNSYYVRQSGLGGQTFGLLFTNAPVACGTLTNATETMPAPSIQICSSLARGSSAVVAGLVLDPTHTAANASAVSFTNGLNGTIESGVVHFTNPGGFPIAFNYSAQPCDQVMLLPACGAKQ